MPKPPISRRNLDELSLPKDLRGIAIQQSRLGEADLLAEISARELGPRSARRESVRRIMSFSTECFYTVTLSNTHRRTYEVIGFFAFLLLNRAGLDALLDAQFDGLDPNTDFLCRPEDTPSAIYSWASVAKRATRMALPAVMEHLKVPRYRDLDIYTRGATPGGALALVHLGFVTVCSGNDPMSGGLLVYRRRTSILAA